MTKIVLALMAIFGCSNLDWANLQERGTGGAGQTSGSGSTQSNAPKHKEPGSGGGVDTLTMTGTWKLNEAKSKFARWAPKNNTVVYEVAGDKVKVTVDGTDSDGKPRHNEWTGKFDGKDYPVTGDSNSDTLAYKKVDGRTLELTVKKDGKVTATGRIAVSADGKSRTVSMSGTNAKGSKVNNTAVYEKQ